MVSLGEKAHDGDFVSQMLALQRDIRGGILNVSIQVERALDLIIANHFCPHQSERWWQLYTMVLASGELTFARKERLVLEILRDSYHHLLEERPNLKATLKKIRENRNLIAHTEVGMTEGFGSGKSPDHLNLIIYRKGNRSVRKLTLRQAESMEKEATKLFLELADIASEIGQATS